MLKLFRKKYVAKLVLWGILILILPAFVIWGGGGLSRSKERGPTYVGLINNKKVSFDEFAQSLGSIKCHIILNYFNQPKVLDLFLNNKSFLGKLAWDRLIMVREAKQYKIKILDQDVINFIRSHPLFSRNGGFDDRIYEYVLRNNFFLGSRSFEEIVRENLALRKLNDLLTKDIKAADDEVLEEYRKDTEKFKISYVMFSLGDFLAKTNVTEDELKHYYNTHKDEFVLPKKEPQEAAKISNFEDVKESIKSYLSEKRAKILATEQTEEEYKKIKESMEKDKNGFEASCAKLGLKIEETLFFSKADYIEGIGEAVELVNIAVTLKKDEISDLIETRGGILIFRVSEVRGFDEKEFEKQKTDYSKKVVENKKNKFLENWLRHLELAASLNIDLNNYDEYYR